MLSGVEHEKKFDNVEARFDLMSSHIAISTH